MLSPTAHNTCLEPLHVGIALFQDPETREDLHWALVVHQTNVRAHDVNLYHIRLRPSSGPREWLTAHTTTFGSRSADDRVFPDTGPRPLYHQYSCIGVVHLGMIQIPGPNITHKFHNWISTFNINRNGNDPSGQFYTENEWCSAGWVLRVVHALENGNGRNRAILGEAETKVLTDEISDMKINIHHLYGRVYGLMGQLREIKRCSRMKDTVPVLSVWPNRYFMN